MALAALTRILLALSLARGVDAAAITEDEVFAAQQIWGNSVAKLGATCAKGIGSDCDRAAAELVDTLYAYETSNVLFKPTMAAGIGERANSHPYRPTREGALSYFVGRNRNYPEDNGFALGKSDVLFANAGVVLQGDTATSMGDYHFTDIKGGVTKAEYTFGYVRDLNTRKLRINVHHSSLPFRKDGHISDFSVHIAEFVMLGVVLFAIFIVYQEYSAAKQASSLAMHSSEKPGSFVKTLGAVRDLVVRGPPPWNQSLLDINPTLLHLLVGGLMNANMGFVNACVWFNAGVATSHATGLMTTCAMALMTANYYDFIRMFMQLLCFTGGSFASACCIGTNQRGLSYGGLLAIIAVILLLASFMSGPTEFSASTSNVGCSFLAALAAGMQNAMTTTFNGATIRSSHVTGTATDIGIEFANIVTGRSTESKKLNLLTTCGSGFFVGACFGTFCAVRVGFGALWIPSGFCLLLSAAMLFDHPQQKKVMGFMGADSGDSIDKSL
jgi:uncharacterized membrane protein YoaK (UPF0700 family)